MDLKEQDIQNKLDEMTAYADSLAQGLPCLPKDVEVLRDANARLAQENHEILEQLFQTAVGLLSTYGKFAYMHPEELLIRALEMVRDADDDCHKDGLQTIPSVARHKIDLSLTAWKEARSE